MIDWLIATPIAHRGLHDLTQGVVENSAAAARGAMAAHYAIECDIQLTADVEAVVFHDFELGRLTGSEGRVVGRSAAALQGLAYRVGADRIMTLQDLLDLIDGQVPLVCEIKSAFDGDMRLADRAASLVRRYRGPVALKSFDPAVIAHLRADPPCPLGIVAEANYDHPEWSALPAALKTELSNCLHFDRTRPDFLSYRVGDLPHAVPFLLRRALGLPVVTWTVRRPEQRDMAMRWADQIVFEGFRP